MLREIEIEVEEDGVLVVVNASQDIVSIEFEESLLSPQNKKRIEKNLKTALDRAQKKAQEISAEKMKPMMGDLGLPGGM